jgi:hypothetical protein
MTHDRPALARHGPPLASTSNGPSTIRSLRVGGLARLVPATPSSAAPSHAEVRFMNWLIEILETIGAGVGTVLLIISTNFDDWRQRSREMRSGSGRP